MMKISRSISIGSILWFLVGLVGGAIVAIIVSFFIPDLCFAQPFNGYYETADNLHFQPPTCVRVHFVPIMWIDADIPKDAKIDSVILTCKVLTTDWQQTKATSLQEVGNYRPFFWQVIDTLKDVTWWGEACAGEHDWQYSGVTANDLYPPYRYRICTRCGLHEKQWKVYYEPGDKGYDETVRRFQR